MKLWIFLLVVSLSSTAVASPNSSAKASVTHSDNTAASSAAFSASPQAEATPYDSFFSELLRGDISERHFFALLSALTVAIVFRVIVPLISHAFSRFMRKRKTLRMVIMDMQSRVKNLNEGIKNIKSTLEEFESEDEAGLPKDKDGRPISEKEPYIIAMGESHEVFDIKSDKWDIPLFSFSPIYSFYAKSNDEVSIIEAMQTENFKSCPKDKRIKAYKYLLSLWVDLAKEGSKTLKEIDINGFKQLWLDVVHFGKSFGKCGEESLKD